MAEVSKRKLFKNSLARTKSMGMFWALILICLIASVISPNFLKASNIVNVIRLVSINGIIAMGMTFVVLTGGVDLSVGAIVGVVAVSVAMMFQRNVPVILAVPAGLLIGAVLGTKRKAGAIYHDPGFSDRSSGRVPLSGQRVSAELEKVND